MTWVRMLTRAALLSVRQMRYLLSSTEPALAAETALNRAGAAPPPPPAGQLQVQWEIGPHREVTSAFEKVLRRGGVHQLRHGVSWRGTSLPGGPEERDG